MFFEAEKLTLKALGNPTIFSCIATRILIRINHNGYISQDHYL